MVLNNFLGVLSVFLCWLQQEVSRSYVENEAVPI